CSQHYVQRIVLLGLLGPYARLFVTAASLRTKLGSLVPGRVAPIFGEASGLTTKLLRARLGGGDEFLEAVLGASVSGLFQNLACLAQRGVRVPGNGANLGRRPFQISLADPAHRDRARRGRPFLVFTLARIVHYTNPRQARLKFDLHK